MLEKAHGVTALWAQPSWWPSLLEWRTDVDRVFLPLRRPPPMSYSQVYGVPGLGMLLLACPPRPSEG
jgi:hypothetical protein